MTFLRSLLFSVLMAIPIILTVTGLLLTFWLSPRQRRLFAMPMVRSILWLIRHVLGIETRVLGAENIPAVPCVILSKHQ